MCFILFVLVVSVMYLLPFGVIRNNYNDNRRRNVGTKDPGERLRRAGMKNKLDGETRRDPDAMALRGRVMGACHTSGILESYVPAPNWKKV